MQWTLAGLAVLVCLYAAVNLARLTAVGPSRHYRPRNIFHSSMWFGLALGLVAMGAISVRHWPVSAVQVLSALAAIQLGAAMVTAVTVRRQLQKTALPYGVSPLSDGRLPTVTVAVPARDADAQLEDCLSAILSSNYPKLEVLALDDNSHDRTPDIIRSFAQSGVRFIDAGKPQPGWLPKNSAYDRLAKAANGQLILFCGVDIRISPQTIRQLVAVMQDRRKHMVSIMPQHRLFRYVPLPQAVRYCWEMALPRRLFNRPPVLSSCWLADRSLIERSGGFSAVRHSVTPEAHFARQAMAADDGYSFVRSDIHLGVTSEKPAEDQRETAIYSRYPQLHRRPEMVLLVSLAEASLLLGPALIVLASAAMALPWVTIFCAGLAFVLQLLSFAGIQHAAFPQASLAQTGLAYTMAIISDMYYLNLSMYRYEFGRVFWRGRDITGPAMRSDAPHGLVPKRRHEQHR